MRDVAERAGVSKMTVSLALRGNGRLPKATIERIRNIATEMGYVPDPVLQALNTHKQQLKTQDRGEVIGLLVDGPEREPWKRHKFMDNYLTGMHDGAEQLGYRVEPFWFGDTPGKRMEQMLLARGIRAVVLAPEPVNRLERLPMQLDWQRFSVLRVGRTHTEVRVPTVTPDHFGAMQMVLEQLHQLGYRRPFLIQTEMAESRVAYRYAASIQFFQPKIFSGVRVPYFLCPSVEMNKEHIINCIKAEQPDVLISTNSSVLFFLTNAGIRVPDEIGFVSLDLQENQPHVSGVDQDLARVGRVAIEMVDLLLRTNSRGESSTDHTVVIGGKWHPGSTVRLQHQA